MTKEQIENSLRTGELKINIWDKLWHYWIVICILIVPITLLLSNVKGYLKDYSTSIGIDDFFLIILPIILSIPLYLLQKDKLKFKTITTDFNREELDKIIKHVASELKWEIHTSNDKAVMAYTSPGLFSGSKGEQITILFDNKRVLVNSICNLNQKPSITSMGRNKKNENTLINHIYNTNTLS